MTVFVCHCNNFWAQVRSVNFQNPTVKHLDNSNVLLSQEFQLEALSNKNLSNMEKKFFYLTLNER